MKKLLLVFAVLFANLLPGKAQIICIRCFDTNDSISHNVNNLILNGSFENGCGASQYYCPASNGYACNITDWTCTDGGPMTYAQMFSSAWNVVPDGQLSAYFGSYYAYNTCSGNVNDISCISDSQCVALYNSPVGHPITQVGYGDTLGMSLSQTVNGLTPGAIYELEFWTGGEGAFGLEGIFGLDIGFGYTMLRCVNTPLGNLGKVYIVEFAATSTSHTIKFTNWGHICSSCTELVLDNVRLYTVAELDPSVAPCAVVGPPPTAVVGCSDSSFCGKQGINFYDLSTNNPTSWNWTFQGAVPSSSTLQNPVNIYYPNYGTFDVTLVACNANGCDTIYMPDYVVEFQTPTVTVSQSNDTLFATGNGNSFQWYTVAGGIINGAYDPYYVATIPGEYYCVVTDSLGCQGASPNFLVTSINEVDAFSEQIILSPNPFNTQLSIRSSNVEEKEMILFDITSRELMRFNFTDQKVIDTEKLANGIYLYEIKGKQGGFKSGRIIKK
jgi:hypothetical protein